MYPIQVRSERIVDGIVHAVGVLGAVCGAIWLLVWHVGSASFGQVTALSIYGAALIATFAASAVYHLAPWPGLRPMLRKVDHAAIYLKIAGTYTPLVVMVGGVFAYSILAIVWGLALIGITLKLFFWQTPGRYGPALYLIMGWMSLGLIWSLWAVVPGNTLVLIAVGGIIYTSGVVFYASQMRFSTAIWHGFVVAASACFFAAIAVGTATLT